MNTQTKETQTKQTPDEILQILKDGNKRFVKGEMEPRNLLEQVKITSRGQFPHTVILGCIDSRATSEQIFDQGIGDIFNTRIAGSVIDEDVLGSLEFSCQIAGAKLIVVLGHTKCGAVTAACQGVEIGHITKLLQKITPSVERLRPLVSDICSEESVNMVVIENVRNSIAEIRNQSPILKNLEDEKTIQIVGGIYNVDTGHVEFMTYP